MAESNKRELFPILNPQQQIPDVQAKFTVFNSSKVEAIDLNEDQWSTDYFVVFFHTGPHDPVSTELLKILDKKNNPGINEFPCKIIAISMDATETIIDWIQSEAELKEFDVPMLSDKCNDIGNLFGVLMSSGHDNPGPGYVSNAVFIVDCHDRVRYHAVLDAKLLHNIEEIQRIIHALRATDNGAGIAMANWKDKMDTVANNRKSVAQWYANNKMPKPVKDHLKTTTEKQEPGDLPQPQPNSLWEYKSGSMVLTEMNVAEADKVNE